ncbi:L-serine ammonia-lyase, iron-sulfur-dependent, subunit alpha [Escherichia coli]
MYALAVSEENAAGGRVVTAPTKQRHAALFRQYWLITMSSIIRSTSGRFPALFWPRGYWRALYKMNASISGAEVGCQGEDAPSPVQWRRQG